MALQSASRFKIEEVDSVVLDANALFAIAEHYHFPAISVSYPDGSARIHIAGTREAWEHAVQVLERNRLLERAYLVLDDLYWGSSNKPSIKPKLCPYSLIPEMFRYGNSLAEHMLEEWFQRVRTATLGDYIWVQVMLSNAEAQNFPELVLNEYGYTIRAGMESWLNAAKTLIGTPAVEQATRMLRKLSANGNPHAPTNNTTQNNGGSTPVEIHITGGDLEWQ